MEATTSIAFICSNGKTIHNGVTITFQKRKTILRDLLWLSEERNIKFAVNPNAFMKLNCKVTYCNTKYNVIIF